MNSEVNPVSLNSFNANHKLYDKVRPDFDPRAVGFLLEKLQVTKGSKVLELAAGTGKFTKSIEDKGYDLVVVEPSTGMLESFHNNFGDIPAFQGSSYDLPVPDSSQDAVIAAQAFHWFADIKSLKEIARVLKPGGKLGLIWNFENNEAYGQAKNYWKNAAHEYITELSGDNPNYRKMEWRNVFEQEQPYFKTPIGEHIVEFEKTMPLNKDYFWARIQSISFITAMSAEKQDQVRNEFVKIFENGLLPEERGSNQTTFKLGVHVVWVEVNK